MKLRSSHRVRGLVLALALATLGVAACGGDDGDESGAARTAAADSDVSTDAGQAGEEEIVIKTQAKINAAEENVESNVSRNEILDKSSIPRTQSGPWHVVSATGAFKGTQGDGQMEIRYEPHTEATEGRETFTGTVEP